LLQPGAVGYLESVLSATGIGDLSALGAARSPTCEPSRNEGRPQPSWWAGDVHELLLDNLDAFPKGMDPAFLGAWIENESSGRHGLQSRLGEVGYFQLHPAELQDMVGADNVQKTIDEIQSSKAASMRWGGTLLRHYQEVLDRFGVPGGTELQHGLLKVMHASRPRGRRWLEHVVAYLGRLPVNWAEFVSIADELRNGEIAPVIDKALPTARVSCSADKLLGRRDAFLLPGESSSWPAASSAAWVAWRTQLLMQAASMLGAARPDFPGVTFVMPLPDEYMIVASGWGQPRTYRNGIHEGIDLYAPIGTPVFAAASGKIAKVSTGGNAGLFVVIEHAGGWHSRYMHLSAADVKAGQLVSAGSTIGRVGTSGTARSGPHLHFDMMLALDRLEHYAQTYGMPRGGFGTHRALGVMVPSEPMIPVLRYENDVIEDAKRNGVQLWRPTPQGTPWGILFAGTAGVIFLGLLGLKIYRNS